MTILPFRLPERCAWCGATGDLALVGIIEQDSGPGGSQHACGDCREKHRILTVEEHPPGALGGVRYAPGGPFVLHTRFLSEPCP